MTERAETATTFRLGMLFAVVSALSFGMSGPFARALMEAGWSPTAAVTARLAGGALLMAVYATLVKPDWWRESAQHARTVVLYGLIPIAGAQLCYYNAVAHLSVGVALLLEYAAPLLVVGWIWLTTRRRPSARTLAGAGLAVAGIMLVLNIFTGAHINAVGVAWGLAAAVCAACYFLMSDQVGADGTGISPVTLAAGGLVVGAAAVALLGAAGVMPLTFTTADVVIAGFTTSWLVPVVLLGVVSTALAYTLGILGVSKLRPGFASLVGLAEVLFAVLWAWLLVSEAITLTQAIGGAVVLTGLALARRGDDTAVSPGPAESAEVSGATIAAAGWPDTAATPQPAEPQG
ncbi:EamA family transporter [Mycolicibacterium palauense]|uniref:EamA family transporter n=1 Tax=Mycolicibacterium palauense TaxID=2034511 RepID=UPI001FE9B7B9|nr:DMT family transporter [Mycolicibacterium palauense]